MINQIVFEAVPVLTATPFQPILAALSNMKVEFSSSFSLGFNKPLSNVVFLRPQKIKAVLIRLLSMVGCIGQPLWLVVPKGDTANSIQSATQCLAAAGSGLKPQSLGHTAMSTSTGEIRPTISQDLTQLKQAYFALTGAFSYLFTVDGADKQNNALSYDLVIDSAQNLINQAQLLKNTRA